MDQDQTRITSIPQLEALYDAPTDRAVNKQIGRLDGHCRAFIAASPFVLLATHSEAAGTDCSPRGDRPGFVHVEDDLTLMMPDRRGNNRIDSLRNIVADPAVGLLFLVPGVTETLRVNGRAGISVDPDLLRRFAVEGKEPKSIIVIQVVEAFMQCSRALVRSEIWNPERFVDRASLPSMGTILRDHSGGLFDAAEYDAASPTLVPATLY